MRMSRLLGLLLSGRLVASERVARARQKTMTLRQRGQIFPIIAEKPGN
jgi:hypothetical protein